jgi:RND family efflux transporter MFP subunit
MSQKHVLSSFPARRFAWLLLPTLFVLPIQADDPKGGRVVYECVGYVVCTRQVVVSSKVSGQVIELNAEEGKLVHKGDVLARLEATEYKPKLDAAVAGLQLARAKLKTSSNEKDIAIAEAEVAVARAKVEQAQWQLDATTIRAPINGTILAKKTEAGNIVSHRAFQVSAGICEMADLRELEVTVDIPERDIGIVAKGQACRIQLDAFPKTTYKGQVSRIMPIADRAKGTIPVRVKIEVPDKDTQLRLEMRANVKFIGEDA